jgi:hypothetical protein
VTPRIEMRGVSTQDRASITRLYGAFVELRNSGWSEPMYIPDDIEAIEVIELGSVGVFRAQRVRVSIDGKEERSTWFATDGEDDYPCRPLLWRRVKEQKSPHPEINQKS